MSAPKHEKELAKELRLRPERPQETRLSRRVLIALSGVSVAAILALTFFALQQRGRSGMAPQLYNTDAMTTADGLAGLPRDYAGLPKEVPKLVDRFLETAHIQGIPSERRGVYTVVR